MHPRILIKEQGLNKKRFISPTQIKNNQALYGDPLGRSKGFGNNQSIGVNLDKMYSPDNRRTNNEIERNQGQRNIGVRQQNTQRLSEDDRMRSNQQKHQTQLQNSKPTSRSKLAPQIVKKDYMTSTLAKLNRQKTRQSDEQSSGSQSRSKISSIKNEKQRKPGVDKDEYSKNVYNQKQRQIKRRPRNNDSQSQGSDMESQEGLKIGGGTYEGYHQTKPPMSPTVRPNINTVKGSQQVARPQPQGINKPLQVQQRPVSKVPQPKPNLQQFVPSQKLSYQSQYQTLPSPREKAFNQQYGTSYNQEKISLTSAQESRTYQHPPKSQIQDPNSSSLAVHLKKAHEQKEQLLQKKINAQRQRNELKQRVQNHQQLLIQLRKQLEHCQMQNMSLSSQLKALKQSQSRTRTQMQGANQRNQQVYRQIHQKYQSLVQQNRKSLIQNDRLVEQNERLRIEGMNNEKRVGYLQSRVREMEGEREGREKYDGEMRRSMEEWRGKVERLEREVRRYEVERMGGGGDSGSTTATLKQKLIQYQRQLTNQKSLIKSNQQQISSLQHQLSIKTQQFSHTLKQKDKQLLQLNEQIRRIHKGYTQKSSVYENRIKEMMVRMVGLERERGRGKDIGGGGDGGRVEDGGEGKLLIGQYLTNNLLPTNLPISQESHQAQQSLQSIITSQTQSINSYKHQLHQSISTNYLLKSQIQQLKSHNNTLKQDLNLLQIQYSALEKKFTQTKQAQLYIVKSQLDSIMRREKELEVKLATKIKQVKQKDQFIQGVLMRGVMQGGQAGKGGQGGYPGQG